MIPEILTITIPSMETEADFAKVSAAIKSLPGIFSVERDETTTETIHVMLDAGQLPSHAVHGTIESAGFKTEKGDPR
ncbi:MAG: hypothetical protein JJU11_17975 [Candidatus Sumerlaeia bacterium]|nr:hypothetical protein [Candidatus Sumerlaeia bacterium]